MKKNITHSLCIMLFLIVAVGCSDDDVIRIYDEVVTDYGNTLKVRNDTSICLMKIDSVISGIPPEGAEVEILNRYIDKLEDRYWVKAKLGDWCVDYGLNPDSVYLVKKIIYSQFIPEKEGCVCVAIPFVPSGEKMGLVNRSDPKLVIGFTGGVNILPIDGLYGNCWTVIYHIGYDIEGNSVDEYFPCKPEELRWYYFWYNLNV